MKKISIILCIAFCFNVNAQDKAIDSLKKLIVTEKGYNKKANYWFQIAGYYETSKKSDSAYNYAIQQSFENILLAKNDTLLGFFYSTLGMHYEEKTNLNLSIEYQLKALAIFEEMQYNFGICLASEQTAVVYKELKNIDEGYRYLINAKKYIEDTVVKKSFLMRGIYSNFTDIFLFKGMLDSALFYNQLSDRFTEKDDAFGVSRNLLNYAGIYEKKNEFDLAETYYRKTIAYADSNKEFVNLISALTNYSKYFLNRNKIDSSFAYAQKSWEKHKSAFGVGGILNIEVV